MAYDVQIALDCADPHELAGWWADVLGWDVEPSDEDFIRRMIAEGHATEEDTRDYRGTLVWRTGAAIRHPGTGLRMLFQEVPEPKTVKNRMHLDVRVAPEGDVEELLERLTGRGATFLHRAGQGPHSWVTITDPEGNELCLS